MTFSEAAGVWLERQRGGGTRRPSTLLGFRTALRAAESVLGALELGAIGRPEAARLAARLLESRTTATSLRLLAYLQSFMADAIELGWAAENPFVRKTRLLKALGAANAPKDESLVSVYTKEQAEALLGALEDPRDAALVRVGLQAGLRRSEALGLGWDDLDEGRPALHVRRRYSRGEMGQTKTAASRRVVPIPHIVLDTLQHLRLHQREAALASGEPAPDGPFRHMDEQRFATRLRRALRRAGIAPPAHPFHALRHTYASLLLSSGVPIFHVCRWLGHSSIQVTADVYGHLLPQRDEHELLEVIAFGPNTGAARAAG